jgi:septum site-determining protein MinC
VTLLRGRRQGLEVVLAGRQLDEALDELDARLNERPGFYRGTPAVVSFGTSEPSGEQLARVKALLAGAGIELRALTGGAAVEEAARVHDLPFESAAVQDGQELERRRALRPHSEIKLSDSARSLVADFAGARSDIAARRRRGEASVPRVELDAAAPPVPPSPAQPPLHAVETAPGTLYHTGTLRGGQALHHAGNIVIVGDVNPGAEIVATGDVLVFGRLAGVAHAGAQGDDRSRVYALDLDPTQLRIAACIAADTAPATKRESGAHVAFVREGHIAVVKLEHLGQLEQGVSSS